MFAAWGFLFFGLLCLPRLAVNRGWDRQLEDWLQGRQAVARFVLAWLLYPAVILMDMASIPEVWNPLVSFPWGFCWRGAKSEVCWRPVAGLVSEGGISCQLYLQRCAFCALRSQI